MGGETTVLIQPFCKRKFFVGVGNAIKNKKWDLCTDLSAQMSIEPIHRIETVATQ